MSHTSVICLRGRALAAFLSGVVHWRRSAAAWCRTSGPTAPVVAEKATGEIPERELLDVGVRLFDPNIPEDEKEQEKQRIYPDVRKAESRYMPVMLRDTLEATGQWGQVRVLPADASSLDVLIDGRIIESSGHELKLAITATDAVGRMWLRRNTAAVPISRAYKDVAVKPRDPFDNLYATIANDLLAGAATRCRASSARRSTRSRACGSPPTLRRMRSRLTLRATGARARIRSSGCLQPTIPSSSAWTASMNATTSWSIR